MHSDSLHPRRPACQLAYSSFAAVALAVAAAVAFDFVASFADLVDGDPGLHCLAFGCPNHSFASYCRLAQHFPHSFDLVADSHSPFPVDLAAVIAVVVAIFE